MLLRKALLPVLRTVCLSGLVIACNGGDDEQTTSSPASGVSPTRKLAELDAQEIQVICEDLAASTETAISEQEATRLRCVGLAAYQSTGFMTTANSVALTFDIAKCEDLTTRCQNGENIGSASPDAPMAPDLMDAVACDPMQISMAFSGCNATVTDYETCLQATIDSNVAAAKEFTCQGLNADVTEEDLTAIPPPDPAVMSACQPLSTQCPNVLRRLLSGT